MDQISSRRDFLREVGRSVVVAAGLGAAHPLLVSGMREAEDMVDWWPPGMRPGLADPYALVLGIAQDAGMPQVGCYAERCDRARSRERPLFAASLALIDEDADRYYLVDATPDITRQLDLISAPGFRARASARRPFDGIFLTHAHIGHYAGLAVLGREGLGIEPTPTYCTSGMADYLSSNGPWELMVREGRLDLRPAEPGEWIRIDERLSARPLLVPHRPEYSDTVGWIFRGPSRSLLYLPDIDSWEQWDLRVEDVVASVDVALLDATFYSGAEVPGRAIADIPHPLVPHSMDVLEEAVSTGSRVVFTHLNNTNPAIFEDSPEAADVRRRGFEVATEGQRFPL